MKSICIFFLARRPFRSEALARMLKRFCFPIFPIIKWASQSQRIQFVSTYSSCWLLLLFLTLLQHIFKDVAT